MALARCAPAIVLLLQKLLPLSPISDSILSYVGRMVQSNQSSDFVRMPLILNSFLWTNSGQILQNCCYKHTVWLERVNREDRGEKGHDSYSEISITLHKAQKTRERKDQKTFTLFPKCLFILRCQQQVAEVMPQGLCPELNKDIHKIILNKKVYIDFCANNSEFSV